MSKLLFCFLLLFFLNSCVEQIKNKSNVVDEVVQSNIDTNKQIKTPETPKRNVIKVQTNKDLIGNYVGWFLPNIDENEISKKVITPDEALYWSRENKINISINDISYGEINGHSIVAGNKRHFVGQITETDSTFVVKAKEPGTDVYDGEFEFTILKNTNILEGNWASFKKIDISKRKFNLEKKAFTYNPNQNLEKSRRYADWEKSKKLTKKDYDNGVYFEIVESFSSATNKIYNINASNVLLTKKVVENLKKGDLIIIRNTIYARHGYSFKNRTLRVFFDAQEWYIPYTNEIKSNLTKIELKNIELLLKYEKNAQEYYDTFGRG